MSITKQEDVIALLEKAQSLGIISDLNYNKEEFDRNITFKTIEGQAVTINWYCNLLTICVPGLDVWANKVEISNTHPGFDGYALCFSYCDVHTATIGKQRG